MTRALRLGFTNCTNHAISTWTLAQLNAVRDLGCGDPIELEGGMPLVDPTATTQEISALAAKIADRVATHGAVVMGEMTLTLELVRRLQSKGVRCFASTTRRRASERVVSAEVVERTAHFEFVRWREYAVHEGVSNV